MTNPMIHHKLLTAIVRYDQRESTKRYYNVYALSHYCKAITDTMTALESGQELRQALVAHFCGRLLDTALRSVGLPKSTKDEQRGMWI